MKEKIKNFITPNGDNYMSNYTRRIKWFLWISFGFITLLFGTLLYNLFVSKAAWNDDVLYVGFFTYLACFTGYNWWRYHQNSVQEEAKQSLEFIEWCKGHGFKPFDHKEGRKRIATISLITILFNIFMITMKLLVERF